MIIPPRIPEGVIEVPNPYADHPEDWVAEAMDVAVFEGLESPFIYKVLEHTEDKSRGSFELIRVNRWTNEILEDEPRYVITWEKV